MPRPLRLPGCLALALSLGACAPDKDPLDSITAATSLSAGDPTSASASGGTNSGGTNNGGTDGGATDSGATEGGGSETGTISTSGPSTDPTTAGSATGGPEVAPICLDYLLCVATATPDLLPDVETAIGPESACWQGDPVLAEQCAESCAAGLEAYGQQYPDLRACGGTGGGTTSDTGDTTNTTNDTGPDAQWGNCGWDATSNYYACLAEPGLPDPDGVHPIDCPPVLPAEGAPCGEINDIGCCTPSGDNYYCGGNVVVVESCN